MGEGRTLPPGVVDLHLNADLVEMADQYTRFAAEVLDPTALPTMRRRVVRTALTPLLPIGPVFAALPLDVLVQTDGDTGVLGWG